MNYSSTASEPPEISTEMTCDQNSKVPTFQTYVFWQHRKFGTFYQHCHGGFTKQCWIYLAI